MSNKRSDGWILYRIPRTNEWRSDKKKNQSRQHQEDPSYAITNTARNHHNQLKYSLSNNKKKLLQQDEELQKLNERRKDLLHELRQLENDIAYKQDKYQKLCLVLENQEVHCREWKREADEEALNEVLHDDLIIAVNWHSQARNSEWQTTSTSRHTSGNVNTTTNNKEWGQPRDQAGPSSDIFDDTDSNFVSDLIRNDPDHKDLPKKKKIDMRFNHNVRAVSTAQRTERSAKHSGQFPSTSTGATRVTPNQRARNFSGQPRSSVTYENIRPDSRYMYREPNRNEEALLALPPLRETDEKPKDKKKKKNILEYPSMQQKFNKKK